jgi:CrcB protein
MTFTQLKPVLAVSLGAVAGGLSRYYLGGWLISISGVEPFPVGTLGINLLGCFLMGAFIGLTYRNDSFSPELRLMVATGFLGSLTTFSSYQLETALLIDVDGWHQDLLYWLGSPLLGIVCLQAGLALGGLRRKTGGSH